MSEIKVNTITPRSGTTLTLGGSGDTVTLAACASQSGFGRTGTVDWCTTAKTSPLTAVSGKGYFINTTGGAITVTLPSSPSAGDIVALKDYANTWDDNAVTVGRAGSKIGGECACATLNTESQSVTLIYVDGTKGWQDIHDSTSDVTGAEFVAASGGNTTITCGDYKTHIFTANGCFVVSSAGNAGGSNTVEYLVVGGGGGGGTPYAGGGGAGGYRTTYPSPATGGFAVTAATFPITIGGGGSGNPTNAQGCSGSNSVFSSITSAGGGGGGTCAAPATPTGVGVNGGSGGGAGSYNPGGASGGVGNTPPVSPPQGNPGGTSTPYATGYGGAGGGGGGGAGVNAGPSSCKPGVGAGGVGGNVADAFFGPTAPSYGTPGPAGSTRYFAGGGGGSVDANQPWALVAGCGCGGAGGGGASGQPNYSAQSGPTKNRTAVAGTANTGGGGGSGAYCGTNRVSAAGGSGFIAIRYKFQ